MLNPSTDPDYSGKVNAPDADHPFGSARDATFENDPAATPLLAKKFDDDWGFDAALLAEAGATPSGTPDTAVSSQRLAALRALFDAYGTVADLATGKFQVGKRVAVTDRANGVFLVQLGGVPNGEDVLDAGGGNTAVTAAPNSTYLNNVVGAASTPSEVADAAGVLLSSGGVLRVPVGQFTTDQIALDFEQEVFGQGLKSELSFTASGLVFTDANTKVRNVKLSGVASGVSVNPSTGVLGNTAVAHQDSPNSGISTLQGVRIAGFDTGYSETTVTDIWTGAYRKIIDCELNQMTVGVYAVGGSTDLRISNTDIRNCSLNGVYVDCPLTTQYANVRMSQVLIENCGFTGVLIGKAKEAGVYVGAGSQVSLASGYLEGTSICVGEGGVFSMTNTYKNNNVRIFGTGRVTIADDGYDTYDLNVSKDVTTGWAPFGVSLTQNDDTGIKGGSISANSTGDGFTSITSDYDQDVLKNITIGDGDEAFLFVQARVRVPTKPTGNYFGPIIRAAFVDSATNVWTSGSELDFDRDQIAAIGTDWAYVNHIIPIRFGAGGGLAIGEYVKWARLEFLFTDAGYTQVGDGAFEVQIKNVTAKLYVPK